MKNGERMCRDGAVAMLGDDNSLSVEKDERLGSRESVVRTNHVLPHSSAASAHNQVDTTDGLHAVLHGVSDDGFYLIWKRGVFFGMDFDAWRPPNNGNNRPPNPK